jgi:hypothetical protein
MLPHLPTPIYQLYNLLPPFASVVPVFFHYSPITQIPSAQVSLGLSSFLLPDGRHFITPFGSLPSSILWTCPYHYNCLVLISYNNNNNNNSIFRPTLNILN